MTESELTAFALSLAGTAADCPFAEKDGALVFRHADTKKWFGLLLSVQRRYFGEGEGSEVCLNAKCPPELSAMLRQSYAGILPAYHMNKVHWNSVILDGSVPEEEIFRMIWMSFNLTRPPLPKASRHRENM